VTAAAVEDLPGPAVPDEIPGSGPAVRAGEPAHDRCDALAEFGEDFEVYRSGAAVTLRCLRCGASRSLDRMVLTALVDEAGAHADTCPGPS
jgi:hypothetical protein